MAIVEADNSAAMVEAVAPYTPFFDFKVEPVVTIEEALSRSSRPDQLAGILERAGIDVSGAKAQAEAAQAAPALRMAGS